MISFALSPLRNLPPPAFSDAASAQAWIAQQKKLPGRFFDAAIEQLERLQSLDCDGFSRAQILETLRQETLLALTNSRQRFAWQPRPLQSVAAAALSSNLRLWSALITGYMQCAESLAAAPGTDPNWIAVATHRSMMSIKMAIEDHFFAGVEPPAVLWQRALAVAQMTQGLGIDEVAVADPCLPDQGQSSTLHQYHLTVLSSVADPFGMHPAEYPLLQKLLVRWRDLPKLATQRGNEDKERWINLRLFEQPSRDALKDPAWLEISVVRAKLKKRLEGLQAGETPASLSLAPEMNTAQWTHLLNRFRRKLRELYDPAFAAQAQISGESIFLTDTIEDAFGLISGSRYNANPKAGASADRVLHDRMAIFGRNSIIQDMASERPKLGEEWMFGLEDDNGVHLSNATDSVRLSLQWGQLVCVMHGNVPQLGKITRVGVRQNGKTEVSVLPFSGAPVAAEASALISGGQTHYPLLLLPAVAEINQPMVAFLPLTAQVGTRQLLQLNLPSPKQITLGPQLDRGANYQAYRIDQSR